jgi:hypothetical protein
MKYLMHRNGQNFGPYSIEEIKIHLKSKNLIPDDLVHDGKNWITITQLLGTVHSMGFEEEKKHHKRVYISLQLRLLLIKTIQKYQPLLIL